MTYMEKHEIKKAGISKEEILKKLEKIFPDADITLTKNLPNLTAFYIRPKINYDTKMITFSRLKRLIVLGNKYCLSCTIIAGTENKTDVTGDLRVRIGLKGSLVSP